MSTSADQVVADIAAADKGEDTQASIGQDEGSDAGIVEFEGKAINFLDLPDDKIDEFILQAEKTAGSVDDNDDDGTSKSDDDDKNLEENEGDSDDASASDDNESSDKDPDATGSDDDDDAGDDEDSTDDKDPDLEIDDKNDTDKSAEDTDDKTNSEQVVINALEDLEKILSPFKANGKEVQVENVDDALTLMQMGANYNKKMAALKPHLKFVKMLEQNDLLDESKITQVIDIMKGNPEAIGKLLKDNKVDPEAVTRDEAGDEYSPGDYKVNDSEVELDTVIDSIRGNESFAKTIDVVSNQWDQKSKAIIFNDPNIIAVIDSHIQTGVFDKISKRMETEKMLGKLTGTPDIAAYKQIGDAMQAAGLFKTPPKADKSGTGDEDKGNTKKPAKKVDVKLNAKRKALGATKESVSKKAKSLENINPLSMSDDEFEKLAAENILI